MPKGMVPLADILNADVERNNVDNAFNGCIAATDEFRHDFSVSQTLSS